VAAGDDTSRHSAGYDPEAAAEDEPDEAFEVTVVAAIAAALDRRAEVGSNDAARGGSEEGADDDAGSRAVDAALDIDASQRWVANRNRLRETRESQGVAEPGIKGSLLAIEARLHCPDAKRVARAQLGERRELRFRRPSSDNENESGEEFFLHGGVRHSSDA
jgi:hypothetical protein